MSLSLTQQYEPTNRLDFKLVKNRDEISTWCTAFEQSFGYKINETTLLHSVDKIAYYTVFLEGQPAGTVILYNTGTVAGIHSLGVVPKMRGKGIAQEIMQFVLKEALSTGAKIATLQASEMARNMYIRLGFTEDFYMKNYKHKTQNNGTT